MCHQKLFFIQISDTCEICVCLNMTTRENKPVVLQNANACENADTTIGPLQ
jgi:hypothetical protein